MEIVKYLNCACFAVVLKVTGLAEFSSRSESRYDSMGSSSWHEISILGMLASMEDGG